MLRIGTLGTVIVAILALGTGFALAPVVSAQDGTPAISDSAGTEANKELVRRFYDAFNANDPAALDRIVAEDFVDSSVGVDPTAGRRGLADFITGTRSEFTDSQATIEELVAEGDMVIALVIYSGSVPVPYEAIEFDLWRIENGQLVELIGLFDAAAFEEQMAAAATPVAGTPAP